MNAIQITPFHWQISAGREENPITNTHMNTYINMKPQNFQSIKGFERPRKVSKRHTLDLICALDF
jgi:hypothetical protein